MFFLLCGILLILHAIQLQALSVILSTDKIKDESQLNVHMLVRKTKLRSSNEEDPIVCSSDGQSKKEQSVNICSNEHSHTTCTRNNGDKKCKAEKSDMKPVKQAMNMQSNRTAIPIKDKKSKIVPPEDDKNCQSTKCIESKYDDLKVNLQ